MCTVSWLRHGGGFELFCNRDERRTRKAADAPIVQERRGVRFVAPVDGDHGGSWIGANQFGLALCLLNRYEGWRPETLEAYRSRGLLLTGLMDCRSVDSVHARLLDEDLSCYQPFTMLALAPDKSSMLVHWTGHKRWFESVGDFSLPLTSSSYADVVATRQQVFRQFAAATETITRDLFYDFHRSHLPAPGPSSVCMHREDGATVSFSHINITEQLIEFFYQPQAPCSGETLKKVVLERTPELERLPLSDSNDRESPISAQPDLNQS